MPKPWSVDVPPMLLAQTKSPLAAWTSEPPTKNDMANGSNTKVAFTTGKFNFLPNNWIPIRLNGRPQIDRYGTSTLDSVGIGPPLPAPGRRKNYFQKLGNRTTLILISANSNPTAVF